MKASYIKPLLPLRDIVIFPSMVVPLFVGREKSIKALQEVMKSDKSKILSWDITFSKMLLSKSYWLQTALAFNLYFKFNPLKS